MAFTFSSCYLVDDICTDVSNSNLTTSTCYSQVSKTFPTDYDSNKVRLYQQVMLAPSRTCIICIELLSTGRRILQVIGQQSSETSTESAEWSSKVFSASSTVENATACFLFHFRARAAIGVSVKLLYSNVNGSSHVHSRELFDGLIEFIYQDEIQIRLNGIERYQVKHGTNFITDQAAVSTIICLFVRVRLFFFIS